MRRWSFLFVLFALTVLLLPFDAEATCLRQIKGKALFTSCQSPPNNQWPIQLKLTFVVEVQDCCSPPGGPVNCTKVSHDLAELKLVEKASQTEVKGNYTMIRTSCGGLTVIRFDGTLTTIDYQMIYGRQKFGNTIIFEFKGVQNTTEATSEKTIEPTPDTKDAGPSDISPDKTTDIPPTDTAPTDKNATDAIQSTDTTLQDQSTADNKPADKASAPDKSSADKNEQTDKKTTTPDKETPKDKSSTDTAPTDKQTSTTDTAKPSTGCGCQGHSPTNPLHFLFGLLFFGFFLRKRSSGKISGVSAHRDTLGQKSIRLLPLLLPLFFFSYCGQTVPSAEKKTEASTDAGVQKESQIKDIPEKPPVDIQAPEKRPPEKVNEQPVEAPAAKCPKDPLPAGRHLLTFDHDGLKRSVIVYIPTSVDNTKPVPLVFNFHGFTSNATQQVLFSEMNKTADREGFVVVYPDGHDNAWNAGVCCRKTLLSKETKDVEFVRLLHKELQSKFCFDLKRVYATGMSNGGFMSHRLGCEAADIIAAIGPVAGVMGLDEKDCNPSRPISVIHFHGTADPTVPYTGRSLNVGGKVYTFPSVKDSTAGWVKRNGCAETPKKTYEKGFTKCETYEGCKAGTKVTLCTSTGVGHCWPGQLFCPTGVSTADISANDAMWEFFKQFQLP